MNVAELWAVLVWVDANVKDRRLAERYGTLREVLRRNAGGGGEAQPFAAEKDDLEVALRAINLATLTDDQQDFLERVELAPYIAERGVNYIEDTLVRNPVDLATAAQAMDQARAKVEAATERVESLRDGLDGLVSEVPPPRLDMVTVRAKFDRGTAIRNVVELRREVDRWNLIGIGVTAAHDLPPEEFQVIGAGVGSLVFIFAAAAAIATSIATIMKQGLSVTSEVFGVLKTVEQWRQSKVVTAASIESLQRDAAALRESGTERILSEIATELSLSRQQNAERVQKLERAVRELMDFVDKGGRVDFVLPEPPKEADGETEEQRAERAKLAESLDALRATVEDVRRLEDQVRRLGPGTTTGDD